jgi:predicted DNA-binding transcriptional regulator AlpA
VQNIRVREAATYVGLSKSTLDKLRCFGGGPRYFKLGRSVVYSTDELDAWVKSKSRADTWAAGNDNAPSSGKAAA